MGNSDLLAAFPRLPQRSCADFEGVIFSHTSCTEVWTLGPDDLEPPLSSKELHPISPLDYPVCCALTRAGGWDACEHTRYPPCLEGAWIWCRWRAGVAQRNHYAHAFVHRLYICVPPCGNSGRKRTIHPAHHCNDVAPGQRHPL